MSELWRRSGGLVSELWRRSGGLVSELWRCSGGLVLIMVVRWWSGV